MKFVIVLLCLMPFIFADEKLPPLPPVPSRTPLPCVVCAQDDKPVCGKSTKNGDTKTFSNLCIMQAEDCGHFEHQYTLSHNGKCA
ncbi:hypothetical protein PVAND_000167 [Polypedilum vanderplanki]|uniref:Kazal-like domain-containing protein n=1 Tax=Polypedilum vanderplanki TaxID=319348 RepID=A0A9J6BJ70_POLVA|nr:hypothetical protein PVAND_000167 [Polypedilum vanderplanki]